MLKTCEGNLAWNWALDKFLNLLQSLPGDPASNGTSVAASKSLPLQGNVASLPYFLVQLAIGLF